MTISSRDNFTTTSGALAAGTNAGTFQITQPVNFTVNGWGFQRAALNNIAFSAGHAAQLAGQRAAYFVLVDAAGAITTIQSQIVAPGTPTDRQFAAEVPNPADRTVIGAIVLTGAFTPGAATALAGLSPVFYNYVTDYSNSVPL